MENSKEPSSNTGYKGIRFVKEIGKFEIYIAYRIKLDYGNNKPAKDKVKRHYLGRYDKLQDAVNAREEFITNLF